MLSKLNLVLTEVRDDVNLASGQARRRLGRARARDGDDWSRSWARRLNMDKRLQAMSI